MDSQEWPSLKTCAKCGESLPRDAEHFYRNASKKDGYQDYCKPCQAALTNKSYLRLKEVKGEKVTPDVEIDSRYGVNVEDIPNDGPVAPDNHPDVRAVQPLPEANYRICKICGHRGPDDEFHMAGYHGRSNTCKSCTQEKRKIALQKKATPSHAVISHPYGSILIDFTDYPEILKTIIANAKQNFRTVNNEILFRLVNPMHCDCYLIRNDLEDCDDGYVNSLIIAAGVTKAVTKKQTTILTIREKNDSGQGKDFTLTIKLPAEYWPEIIELSQGHKYALVLVRVRE